MPTETVHTVEITREELAALRAVLELAGWLVSAQSNRSTTRRVNRAQLILVSAILDRCVPVGTDGNL